MKLLSLPLICTFASCASGPGEFTPENKTERQMVGMLEKFDRWDYNGDGKLVASELKDAQRRTGKTPKEILKFYDEDEDGGITLREAQGGLERTDEVDPKAAR